MTANDAAAIAIQLFRLDARLCDQHPIKVARTTNNPSVSGNSLYEATTSVACSSNTTQDTTLHISHDASVQTNPCTVFQVNPVHTTDISKSISDAQITQITKDTSQTNGDVNSISLETISVEQPMAKEHKSQSFVPVESMAQNQDNTSTQASKEDNDDVFKNGDDHVKPCEQNNSVDQPVTKNILDRLDVASLSIPDSMMHNVQDMNLALMETIKKPLKHIASFQTGNNFNIF